MHVYPLATDIASATKTILSKVYTDISGVFTVACVVVLAVCLLGMLFCKNGKAVEEFRTWRRTIVVCWIVFNLLGSIIAYGNTLFADTKWTG